MQTGKQTHATTNGRLGVLTVGMGAVATTAYAGVLATRRGLAKPIGSLTQLGRLDPVDAASPTLSSALPLAPLANIVFGGWDPIADDAYTAAAKAGVLSARDRDSLREELAAIRPMEAVFDRAWVKRLEGTGNIKRCRTKWDAAQALMADIEHFKTTNKLDRVVIIWCASTEAYKPLSSRHKSLAAFEAGLRADDADIAPSQVYAYAALRSGIPFANGAPNVGLEAGAFHELAQEYGAPMCGKDFKTGQTFMKTAIAPALKARLLGIRGWFSTNILGNRDGEVLDDPDSFKSKEVSKLGVLDAILEPEHYKDLYGDISHLVRINYYPPRGDDKEGWDNIDIFGWMGYPMQIKIDFLCKDSILAAPIVLDLALLLDLSQRAGQRGVQEWLSFYFKSPLAAGARPAENDLFRQQANLYAMLHKLAI